MTSQSPAEAGTPTKGYVEAWASIRYLVIEQGLSWSGREKDHLFLNLGDGTFAELSALSAADSIGDGRALALCDWDDDGKLDLFLKSRTAPRLAFFHNRMVTDGHSVTLELRGVRCNRDAIGARVEVEAGGRKLRKTLHAGDGYLAQSSKRLHFGLGRAARIERLTVAWPDGTSDAHADLAADLRYAITQGEPEARVVPARRAPVLEAAPSSVPQAAGRANARVALVEKLPLGALGIPGFDAPGRRVSDLAGGPVLLDLWGTTCAGCLSEFGEWRDRRAELERSRLRIVTLCTDAGAEPARAREILERFGLARDAGLADAAFLEAFEVLLADVVGPQKALPLPTSLLLDERGQLVVLYLGRAELGGLLEDVATLARMDIDNRSGARLLGGMRLMPRGRDFAALAEKFRLLGRTELASFYAGLASE